MSAYAETGADFDGGTGEYLWDGRALDFRVWVYDNGGATYDRFSVVVEQEHPMGDENASPEWYAVLMSAHGGVFTADAEGSPVESDLRIAFEDLPQAGQEAVWNIARTGWLKPEGGEYVYDKGEWR